MDKIHVHIGWTGITVVSPTELANAIAKACDEETLRNFIEIISDMEPGIEG